MTSDMYTKHVLYRHLIVRRNTYEACPESKDTKVSNMYNIFNLQKQQCE
jgi:hypothetical protein